LHSAVLDKTHLRYSYKQHCIVTLSVGEVADQHEWHLPTYDPKNEAKYHYKLHSLDIYFWTQKDALQFVNGVRRVLPAAQVEMLDEPGPPPIQPEMSSIVQKLENAAISDPAYTTPQPPPNPPSFAAPPISAVDPSTFVPMAYNPAAPAAPEAIRHREKTPPPEDGGIHPLAVAVAYDQQQPFTPAFAPPGHFPGQAGLTSPGLPPPHFGGPPSHPGLQRAATMPVQSGLASPGLTSPFGAFPGSPGFAPPPPPPPQQVPQAHQQSHTQTPPITSPGLPPPPPGGYSQYSYSNPTAASAGTSDFSIHQQVYRPTDGEAIRYKPKVEPRGKLEENAGRLERGVSGMFKKFEKKFG
jgi:hypothetical protein